MCALLVHFSRGIVRKGLSKQIKVEQNGNEDYNNLGKNSHSNSCISSGYSSFASFTQASFSQLEDCSRKSGIQGSSAQELFKEIQNNSDLEHSNDKYPLSVNSEHIELPKKRWLREAVQDQQRWDMSQDLARPINWGEDVNIIEYENQKRPTVLMKVQEDGEKKQVSRADIQIAMALVELKNGKPFEFGF